MKKSSVTIGQERRRGEAEARQKKYDSLSLTEKLEVLSQRPGKSLKQTARLTK